MVIFTRRFMWFSLLVSSYQKQQKVCRLKKALYDLKQALRAWYAKIDAYLTSKGLKNSSIESTFYIKKDGGDL